MWKDKHNAVCYNRFKTEVIHFKKTVHFLKQMLATFQGVANVS